MLQTESASIRVELERRRDRLVTVGPHDTTGQLQALLREVDSALERVETESFGICDGCHDPIEHDRIEADPLTRVCLGCLSDAEREALEKDLELAARIQHRLLPERTESHCGWETHYHYEPLGPVSGDHVDLIRPDTAGDDLFFLFGDVSGKGVAASLLMAHLQASFRSLVGLGIPLQEAMQRANHLFVSSTPANVYATLVAGRLSAHGELEVVNAGHCPPLYKSGKTVISIEATGLPLGLFGSGRFVARSLQADVGDLLFLYTDGMSEATDGHGKQYEADRLAAILEQGSGLSARAAVHAGLADLAEFSNGTPRDDDLTLMSIRRT